jgi:uncharacterized protein YjiS (DUF1127 family)
MSMMSRTAVRSARGGSMSGILRWLAACVDAPIAYFHRRAMIKTLQKLDDRELRDIGLPRCHIEAAVNAKMRRRGG